MQLDAASRPGEAAGSARRQRERRSRRRTTPAHREADSRQRAVVNTRGEWQEHEIVQLNSYLPGRIAKSWQHADECVMHLAAQLHRDPRSVRDKATELGFGAAVDYRFSKALKRASSE